ncbi:type 1 glutamine amidotransferase domain-containing protein [Rugamonas sp.]|uniref:type 1 glutamine amidotransferase domain-containing protein n=1 Tax=Rugamonas sp. TaxID=1926287 RepID=UPI0025EBE49E|nr:type 1 glutamine amidotransferase domain-containing protein [Rugamonas sp.]
MTASAPTILMPLPHRDFDPSEVALTWRLLRAHGYEVHFATPDGRCGHGDPLMLSGRGLDLWGAVPLLRRLKLMGLILRANGEARAAYAALERDPRFLQPLRYDALDAADYDGLILPGGHWSRGMRAYLEDATLQRCVARCFARNLPVGAICHGVVLAARSVTADGAHSVLHGRRTVALTWAMENKAWQLMRFGGRFWDAAYYRTYEEQAGEPAGYRGVQAEVTRALASPADFVDVPARAAHRFRKTSGLFRDTAADTRAAWVVRDGNYVSARWPGDVHLFAQTFIAIVGADQAARSARPLRQNDSH